MNPIQGTFGALVLLAAILGGVLCWWAVKVNTEEKEARKRKELEESERRESDTSF